jgi:hypothetical protein
VICLASLAIAQQNKTTASGASVTGHYEGTAKDRAENVITVALELTEKDGALSGMINSSHGDFTITGGSRKGEEVTIEFDAGGPVGTLTLRRTGDQLVGTWDAGEDGGPVDLKRVAAKQDAPKGKS